MKRIVTLFLFVLIPMISALAQYVVTPSGLAKTEPDDKDYYIIEVPELSQEELYSKTLQFISQTYVSAKDVISGQVENEMLAVTGLQTIFYDFNVRYKLVFQFKDGRVRFDMPSIISMKKFQEGNEYNLTFSRDKSYSNNVYIFNNKGELRGMLIPSYKIDIENLFNSLYNKYVDFMTNKTTPSEDDDW